MGFIQVLVHFERVGLVVESTHQSLMQRRKNCACDIDHRAMYLRNGANHYKIFSLRFHG